MPQKSEFKMFNEGRGLSDETPGDVLIEAFETNKTDVEC